MPTWPTTQAYPGATEPDTKPTFDNELSNAESAPSEGYKTRYSEVARLHALGKTNNEIARTLGYTAVRISIILRDPYIQSEIARYRKLYFDGDVVEVYKKAALDGARVHHEVILDPAQKTQDRLAASRFAHEVSYGKAKQQVEVDHGGIVYFTELIKEMSAKGEVLDVTPSPKGEGAEHPALPQANAAPTDDISAWLDSNIAKP